MVFVPWPCYGNETIVTASLTGVFLRSAQYYLPVAVSNVLSTVVGIQTPRLMLVAQPMLLREIGIDLPRLRDNSTHASSLFTQTAHRIRHRAYVSGIEELS